MIGEMMSTLNGWIANFGVLSEAWRVGIVVFALVFGTATVAYIAGHVIGALERRFAKTDNVWDDSALHVGFVRRWWRLSGCRVCIGLLKLPTIIPSQRFSRPMEPCCRLASFLLSFGR